MKKNYSCGDSLLNEPENYSDVRVKIQSLMDKLMDCKQELKEIAEIGVIQEQFSEESQTDLGNISQVIYSLGAIYGYTLADDTLEGVLTK